MIYDNAHVAPWFSGLTASDFTTWANDCSSNWVNAWTSRFSLTAFDIATITSVQPCIQQAWILGLQQAAIELASGRTIDTSGLNVSGGGKWIIHLDTVWTGGPFPTLSIWWVHIP